jgi:hypothetical protein
MTTILLSVLVLILAVLLANWYFDPLARRAAEKTLNEMLSSGEPDELAEREWW